MAFHRHPLLVPFALYMVAAALLLPAARILQVDRSGPLAVSIVIALLLPIPVYVACLKQWVSLESRWGEWLVQPLIYLGPIAIAVALVVMLAIVLARTLA